MRYTFFATGLFGLQAAAFPAVVMQELAKRQGVPSTSEAKGLSAAMGNCGLVS
jgi:hypothetical protein